MPLSLPNLLTADQQGGAPYTRYIIDVTYVWNGGVMQCPVGSAVINNTIPSVAIQVAAPWGEKVVTWTAERDGADPALPHPIVNDPNLVLKSVVISNPSPTFAGADCVVRKKVVKGVYTYIMKLPPWAAGAGVAGAKLAYDASPLSGSSLSPGQFVQGLI